MVSLFPENTWKHRRNGMRADLVQMLADLHPGVHAFSRRLHRRGHGSANRYSGRTPSVDVAERPENWNRWQDAMSEATAPQYYQTYGLGFFEFFQLCEDIGAEPVPILNCGTGVPGTRASRWLPLDQLGPFVQDALDLMNLPTAR